MPFRTRSCLPLKKRKCNECGSVAFRRGSSACKKWCKVTKKMVHCGTYRIIRTGQPNIIKMEE